MEPAPHCIVLEQHDEPHRRRMIVFGPYESQEDAYAALPDLVFKWIEDEDEAEPVAREMAGRIAISGDGTDFGFTVYLAPLEGVTDHGPM